MNEDLNSRRPLQRLRLPRTAILRGRQPFRLLFESRQMLRSASVDFRFRLGTEPPVSARIAFVAAKRLGNAVHRNAAKRRLREAYRQTAPEMEQMLSQLETGLEGAFIARRSVLDVQELMQAMRVFYSRIAHIHGEKAKSDVK